MEPVKIILEKLTNEFNALSISDTGGRPKVTVKGRIHKNAYYLILDLKSNISSQDKTIQTILKRYNGSLVSFPDGNFDKISIRIEHTIANVKLFSKLTK
jgi:hypothetical protein